MVPKSHRRQRPGLESLEARLVMSLAPTAPTYGLNPPANTIALSLGNVTRPATPSATTVNIAPRNLTPGKATTQFGVFVQPYGNSRLVPKVVSITQNGQELPVQHGRVYNPSQARLPTDKTVAFFATGSTAPVTIKVEGRGFSSGQYTVETTLIGDINGDGTVNLADAQLFAPTFTAKPRDKNYNAAADYNQSGLINQNDAIALERNMAMPFAPHSPYMYFTLPPGQLLHSSSKNSGGLTRHKHITIVGYTIPNSVLLVDSRLGNYRFNSQAIATDSRGFFRINAINTQGLNNYDFKAITPFGQQYIQDYPVVWTTYAEPNSPYVFVSKPKRSVHAGGGKIGSNG